MEIASAFYVEITHVFEVEITHVLEVEITHVFQVEITNVFEEITHVLEVEITSEIRLFVKANIYSCSKLAVNDIKVRPVLSRYSSSNVLSTEPKASSGINFIGFRARSSILSD